MGCLKECCLLQLSGVPTLSSAIVNFAVAISRRSIAQSTATADRRSERGVRIGKKGARALSEIVVLISNPFWALSWWLHASHLSIRVSSAVYSLFRSQRAKGAHLCPGKRVLQEGRSVEEDLGEMWLGIIYAICRHWMSSYTVLADFSSSSGSRVGEDTIRHIEP